MCWTDFSLPVCIFKHDTAAEGFLLLVKLSCLAGVPTAVLLLDNDLLIKQKLKLSLIGPLSMAVCLTDCHRRGGTGRGQVTGKQVNNRQLLR